jgi:hypothetical protein
MDLDKVLRVQEMGKRGVYSLYRSAITFKMTSTETNDKYLEIISRLPKDTPRYVRAFMQGMREALVSDLYNTHLEFCYKIKGKLYSVNRDSDRYYEDAGITPSQLHEQQESNGHYWRKSDKVFFKG